MSPTVVFFASLPRLSMKEAPPDFTPPPVQVRCADARIYNSGELTGLALRRSLHQPGGPLGMLGTGVEGAGWALKGRKHTCAASRRPQEAA